MFLFFFKPSPKPQNPKTPKPQVIGSWDEWKSIKKKFYMISYEFDFQLN